MMYNYRDVVSFTFYAVYQSGLGEQCTICIGFSEPSGKPVAGVVYRPIPQPNTWAIGAASESFRESYLNVAPLGKVPLVNSRGLLTSNGGISSFVQNLISNLHYERVPSGGAGNKMLMLLEGKGSCYIQDRGVSRWDTCGAQAVLEAYGGALSKLSSFVSTQQLHSYTYLKTNMNLDFVPGLSALTPHNAAQKELLQPGKKVLATSPELVQPYSNLCGLLALSPQLYQSKEDMENLTSAISVTASAFPPSYD